MIVNIRKTARKTDIKVLPEKMWISSKLKTDKTDFIKKKY